MSFSTIAMMKEVMRMGLLNSIKETVTGGDDSSEAGFEDPEVDTMFDEGGQSGDNAGDIDEEMDFGDEPVEEDVEDEVMEWESAYKFAEWFLEDEGFADMTDFGEKAMMYKLERSPMYRDRIENGLSTLANINSAKQQLQELKGEDSGSKDYEEMAKKLRSANEVIEGTRKLSGEDEMIVQQGMGLARDAIEAICTRAQSSSANVNTSMERTDEEI